MEFVALFGIAVALSMDAFSVSICMGLSEKRFSLKTALLCGVWFGGFQGLMTLIGFFFGRQFEHLITSVDHWIAFGLLVLIGANMIREGISGKQDEYGGTDFKTMLLLAVATSIDALAIGVGFALVSNTSIWMSALVIGLTTFVFSFCGVRVGNLFGARYNKVSVIVGGSILILLGTKILLEHLGVISF